MEPDLMDKTLDDLTVKDGLKVFFGVGATLVLIRVAAAVALPHLKRWDLRLREKNIVFEAQQIVEE